jgi:hypothetical protein
LTVFTEDKEGAIFAKALLKSKASKLNFIDCTLSCSSLIDLASRKIPSFIFPSSMIILDGDVKNVPKELSKIKKLQNVITLPKTLSPERLLAAFLWNLDDNSPVWASIDPNFNKDYCFRDIKLTEIESNREKAKLWFSSHIKLWGYNATKVINPWAAVHQSDVDTFILEFVTAYNKFATELSINKL